MGAIEVNPPYDLVQWRAYGNWRELGRRFRDLWLALGDDSTRADARAALAEGAWQDERVAIISGRVWPWVVSVNELDALQVGVASDDPRSQRYFAERVREQRARSQFEEDGLRIPELNPFAR